ncbi:hypothetical protein PM082_006194 [Marasmius tenuissimus]|nr:hypothetical protein PM082_006194 [Marasmius tenuissimus]
MGTRNAITHRDDSYTPLGEDAFERLVLWTNDCLLGSRASEKTGLNLGESGHESVQLKTDFALQARYQARG